MDSVKFTSLVVCEVDHFHIDNFKSGALKPVDDLTAYVSFDSIGFYNDECPRHVFLSWR